jgi:hypothetical protein
VVIASCSVLMAPLGARAAHALPVKKLKRAFAVVLFTLAIYMLYKERQPGLYFIGEVVDVTGWLGGYNFQWAWASAAACGQALHKATQQA